MPPGIGTLKCLLTKRRTHPGLGVPVLVETCFSFPGSEALHDGKPESNKAVDSEDVDKEVVVVAGVDCADSGLLKLCDPRSGEPVRPRFPSSFKDLVVKSEGLRWEHSRAGGQARRACSRQQIDSGETCFHNSLHLHHELLDSRRHHHIP